MAFMGRAYVLANFNQPVEGTIIQTAGSTGNSTPKDKYLTTTYYSTLYPARYKLSPKPTNSASIDAVVLIAHQQSGAGVGSKITLTIVPMPEGGVTEDSSYKLSAGRPDLYALTEDQYGSDNVQIATRSDPSYERVILWPHGSYLLTITLTAGAQTQFIDNELQTVLTNLQWLAG